jgi:hypothetical protein
MLRNVFFVFCLASSAGVLAQETGPRVALVPVQNLSGEKWEDLKRRQSAKSDEYMREQFLRRGFQVINADEVARAIQRLEIDFTDEEQHKRSTLYELGRHLDVDYILLGLITSTSQAQRDRTFYTDIEGRTDVKVWLLDVRSEKPVLSAKPFTGRSGGNRITFDNKGSERQIQAAVNGFRDALKEFFSLYPERQARSPSLRAASNVGFGPL